MATPKKASIGGKKAGITRRTYRDVIKRCRAEPRTTKTGFLNKMPENVILNEQEGQILKEFYDRNRDRYARLNQRLGDIHTMASKERTDAQYREGLKLNQKLTEFRVIKRLLEKQGLL